MYVGVGYAGSSAIETSVANGEVLPVDSKSFNYQFYKFSFDNDQDCKIVVNGGKPIFLRALQGFKTASEDAPIRSFKIVEAGVTYNWAGSF